MDWITTADMIALGKVIFIDLVLAGDNAIVVGLAASRVAPHLRAKVIFWGIAGAVVLRILFAAVTAQLLAIVGLTFAGGVLLLYVCWKMFRELQHGMAEPPDLSSDAAPSDGKDSAEHNAGFWPALMQIIIADVSMSLDNVLAVAGAAKGSTWILVVGLLVAIILMAVAATYIAKLLVKYPFIAWLGLLVILYVAVEMMWRGGHEIACAYVSKDVCSQGFVASLKVLLGR
jgi:YjbE family integral membrane protein